MNTPWFNSAGRLAGMLLLPLAIGGPAAAQQGAIAGRVTDKANSQAIAGARVLIVGTSLITQTNADGRYLLQRVPIGAVTVRASAIGYGAVSRSVTVAAGEIDTVDVQLALTAFSLDEVVATASGEQEKREVGNVVSTIDVGKLVEQRPITDMNDVLVAKAPGVQVLPGNLTGAGARVRIRGTNSLSLDNEPIYIIDGIRLQASVNSSSIGIGGTNPSRLNDINPDEIESIEIVKGPSASTLYGTAASNGVVVIKTKHGHSGPARWNVYAEGGVLTDQNTYPTAYRGWTAGATPTNGAQCILTAVAAGTCTQDSVTRFNLFTNPKTTPLGTGYREQYGAQVAGGSDATRYFVSGEWGYELGLLRLPPFAWSNILTARQIATVPYEQYRPNARRETSVRANVDANLNPRLDLSVSSGFISSTQRLPQTDNNTVGLLSNGFGGPGNMDNGHFGYRLYTPDQFFAETVTQDINRFIGSGTMRWRPTTWLSGRVVAGVDYTSRVDTDLCLKDQCSPFNATYISGFKQDNRTNFFDYTANADATGSFELSSSWRSRTTVGVQYIKDVFDRNAAYAENLAPGATTVTAGAIPQANEATAITVTLGAFVEQQMAFRDRLFLTAALRTDKNSAFGQNFKAVYYPKLSVSYLISRESFFPTFSWLNSFRVRGALGASGVQPGTTDALRYFSPGTSNVDGVDQAAIVFSAIGNPNLKPERARELELGFDADLLSQRVHLEVTGYNKRTADALIARTVAPSVGASATRLENLGAVVNRGIEFLIDARVFDRPAWGWSVSLSGSHNTNFIADMGGVAPIIGTTLQERQGYPIDGYWQRAYTYSDVDGNGIITANEIKVADNATFVGYSQPRWEVAMTNNVDLLNRRLQLSVLLDLKADYYLLNGTDRIRCQSRLNCRGLVDPTASLWEQARVVALRETGTTTQYGFMEKADFLRLRELAVTYVLPQSWAQAARARSLSITLAGRNLIKWTSYTGLDPESNYFSGSRGSVSDFQTQPPPTYWTFRVNAGF